jgi:hypothetical protein
MAETQTAPLKKWSRYFVTLPPVSPVLARQKVAFGCHGRRGRRRRTWASTIVKALEEQHHRTMETDGARRAAAGIGLASRFNTLDARWRSGRDPSAAVSGGRLIFLMKKSKKSKSSGRRRA